MSLNGTTTTGFTTMTSFTTMTAGELRPQILAAALPHVPFDGWTEKVLMAAAADLGLAPERAALCFPGGGRALMLYWLKDLDRRHQEAIRDTDFDGLKIREKITACLHLRFALNGEHKESVYRAVTTLPFMADEAAKANWRLADSCWRGIGDQSTDHNYYTKRLTLAAVYAATLLFWLEDDSENQADSWAFLERRIETVMQIEKIKARLRSVRERAPSPARFLGRLRYGNFS